VEVTPASSVAGDGSSEQPILPAPGQQRSRCRGSSYRRHLRRLGLLQQLLQRLGRPVVVQGVPPEEAQGSSSSRTLSPVGARKKSPAAPVVDAPAPHAGGGAASPSGWTNQPQDGCIAHYLPLWSTAQVVHHL
jgi:hypothetical protein